MMIEVADIREVALLIEEPKGRKAPEEREINLIHLKEAHHSTAKDRKIAEVHLQAHLDHQAESRLQSIKNIFLLVLIFSLLKKILNLVKKSQLIYLNLSVKIFKINKIRTKPMSRRNNGGNQDYDNDRNDDLDDYPNGPKPIKAVIEDDRYKTKPNYVEPRDQRYTRPQQREEKPKYDSKPNRQ